MYRTSSTTRVSDEFLSPSSASPAGGVNSSPNPKPTAAAAAAADLDNLPMYDPLSDVGKKEKNRLRSAENAIHLIPLLLVLCAGILWFFSSSDLEIMP